MLKIVFFYPIFSIFPFSSSCFLLSSFYLEPSVTLGGRRVLPIPPVFLGSCYFLVSLLPERNTHRWIFKLARFLSRPGPFSRGFAMPSYAKASSRVLPCGPCLHSYTTPIICLVYPGDTSRVTSPVFAPTENRLGPPLL